jgi:hypothetical protein
MNLNTFLILLVSVSFLMFLFLTFYFTVKLYYKIKTKQLIKKLKEQKLLDDSKLSNSITVSKGWNYLNWNKAERTTNITNLSKVVLLNKAKWVSDFNRDTFLKIHHMDFTSLLTLAYNLHTNRHLSQDESLSLKRLATVNSIVFNFKIPSSIWIIDEVVLSTVIRYLSLVEVIDLKIKDYKPSDFTYVSTNKPLEFEMIKQAIPYAMSYIAKIGTLNKGPNIFYLFDLIKKNNKEFFKIINKDIINLKRVLTMSYCLAGLELPSDYIYLDENVYKYLTNLSPTNESNVEVIKLID